MKRIFGLSLWAFIIALVLVSCSTTKEVATTTSTAPTTQVEEAVRPDGPLYERLRNIPGITAINKLKVEDHFEEHYELWFEQNTDPSDPNSPRFKQRVLLAHVSYEAPVIVELQGYKIWGSKAGELATLFKGNQVTIEHRYFEDSRPKDSIPWETLTVTNAAIDQHKIIEKLKTALYPDCKFISTGISKGGQTTMIHRAMFPDDVDASVCYVAPLNFEREDPRIWRFLETVGTAEQRQQIMDFQLGCFKQKSRLLKELEKLAEEKNYTWDFSTEVALEYYILEYSFAFWQWGAYKFSQIPGESASPEEKLLHMLSVSGISFFESSGVEPQRPFFYAAMSEMGMYDYDTRPFKEYLSQEQYNFEFTVPGLLKEYDSYRMKKVNDFIQKKATNMLFIYGELDTWSATAINLSDQALSRGLVKYVKKGGSHATRIRSFEKTKQTEIIGTIEKWIKTRAIGFN